MRKRMFLAALAAASLAVGSVAVAAPAIATQPDVICPDGGDWVKTNDVNALTATATAPTESLIAEVCYKAGNEQATFPVDPPATSVEITSTLLNNGGQIAEISHYSIRLVDAPSEPITVRVNLTYMMDCVGDTMNTWRVRNPHTETITVSWRNAGNTLTGTHVAAPGDTFFETPRVSETIIISWGGGDTGIVAGSVTKASGNDVPASDPKCLPPAQECIVTYGDWFTEQDDTVPALEENGLRFIGGVNDSMGIGIGIGGNLQGLPEITYVAEGDAYSLARFYPRLVINSSADGGPAYNSITVTSEGPVNASSVASGRVKIADGGARVSKTIAEWIAYYPNNSLLAFFMNTDSSSNGDVSVLLKSVSAGECFAEEWGYGPQPETKIEYGEWMTGEYDCDDTTVSETRTVTTTTYALLDDQWVGTITIGQEGRIRDLTPEEIDDLFCPGEQPDDKVEVTEWVDGEYDCDDTTVTQTRTVTTTPYVLDGETWVLGTPTVVEETQIRDLTVSELLALDCDTTPETPLAYTGGEDTTSIALGALAITLLGGALLVAGRRLAQR